MTAVAPQDKIPDFVASYAQSASELGVEMAGIAGTLDDLGQMAREQHQQLNGVDATLKILVQSNHEILNAAESTASEAQQARTTISQALGQTRTLAASAMRTASSVHQITQALKQVTTAASDIGQISTQTRLVAFNASVEAGRAGEAGRGFAVIAEAVKDLSEKVQASSRLIISTLSELSAQIAQLESEVRQQSSQPGSEDISKAMERSIATFEDRFASVQSRIGQICDASRDGSVRCVEAGKVVTAVARQSAGAVESIAQAAQASGRLLSSSEKLIVLTAESGSVTEDTPFIEKVIATAGLIGQIFEAALINHEISERDLFDDQYRVMAGTNPQQHDTRFTGLTDRVLPPIQEPVLEFSPRVVFCAAVDRNGYLPTHNRKFSQPQGRDPVWNAANCRSRRIFNDRTGLSAGRNTNRFLLQTYRRDMGGGQFVIMKDVSAPIFVNGRHWGGFRMGYRTN